jgi:hypothetical protein
MSELLDDGELPSGYFFAGPTATPVGGSTGVLPANGAIVSLETYPGLSYLNENIGYLPGPAYLPQYGAPGFNVNQSSGPGGEMLYNYSAVIGPYYILCGSNNQPNSTIGIGASLSVSSDLVNWTISQINTLVGTICVGIVKVGATYYATVQGTGQYPDAIYSSTNLTSWTIAFSYTGVTAVYDVSAMAATSQIAVSLRGGNSNITFFNGTKWVLDTNNVGAHNYLSNLNTLSTGEIGGIALTSSGGGAYSFSAWKVGVGATTSTISLVEPNFTGSALCPSGANLDTSAPNNPFNAKLSYVGGHYVAIIFGIVYTSPDFTHWTKQGDKQFIALENMGGTMYAISIDNNVNQYFSSPDGINWTLYYTSQMNQGYIAGNCGALILPLANNVWAVCSSVFDQYISNIGNLYGQQGSWISFVYNPTTTPLVMQSPTNQSTSVCTFSVTPNGAGIMGGGYTIVPSYNPTVSVLMPNLTSPYGAGTEMFMKI